jgi:hypothetical protein
MLTKNTIGGSWGRAVGWNAGAISTPVLAGDVELTYVPATGLVGAIVGLRAANSSGSVAPGLILFGFYCYTNRGSFYATPIEANVLRSTPFTYVANDTLAIIRNGGAVSYTHNGTTVFTSSATSRGLVSVGACLYAAGDEIA